MTIFSALSDLRESATRKYNLFCDKIAELEEKAKTVHGHETEFKSVTITANPAKLNDLLLLNFGGEYVDIVRSSLLHYHERNGLIALLSGNYDQLLPKDKNGRIFFDIDKRVVEPLFNYCRDLAMWNGEVSTKPVYVSMKDKRYLGEGKVVCDYFQAVQSCVRSNYQRQLIIKDSLILSQLQSFDERALLDMFPRESQFSSATLLYRGSRDGFKAKDYHDKCDGRPNTVTIIRDTEGNGFGGYASAVPCSSTHAYVSDPLSFLFSLAVESKVNVVQHKPLPGRKSGVLHYKGHMSVFGCVRNGCDLIVTNNCSSSECSGGLLGRGYDSTGNVIPRWTDGNHLIRKFNVQDIEVFQLSCCDNNTADVSSLLTVSSTDSNKTAGKTKRVTTGDGDDDDDELVSQYVDTIREQEVRVLNEAEALIAELQFVAKHCGVTLPPRSEPVAAIAADDDPSDDIDQFASAVAYIRELNAVLQSPEMTVGCKVVDTVTINAGGRLVTTAKATLQQALEGSILANMTSDVWGHGFDRDGNIYQDVNSELLAAVINHLRLKQLLCGASFQVPPIVVYEEQKTALDNLLSFYMLTDLPVSTVKD